MKNVLSNFQTHQLFQPGRKIFRKQLLITFIPVVNFIKTKFGKFPKGGNFTKTLVYKIDYRLTPGLDAIVIYENS